MSTETSPETTVAAAVTDLAEMVREQRKIGYEQAIADLRAEADRQREQSTALWAVFASGADFLESRLKRPAQITEPPIPPDMAAVRDHEGEPLETGDEEGCGYSWDHTIRRLDPSDDFNRTWECTECGAEGWDEETP